MAAGRPGKTAPRLLQDLLTYDARFEHRQGRNLLTSAPPHFDPLGERLPAVSPKNCRHSLKKKAEQTHLPGPGEAFERPVVYQVASFCSKCRWHFDVAGALGKDSWKDAPCRKAYADRPLHHFVFDGDHGQALNFACSSDSCPTGVRIRVTPPRLTDADVHLLTDHDVLRRRWEEAQRIAGDRADASMARQIDAIDFLNAYLQDSLNPVKGKSRVPLLNRKFLKTFGNDCDAILKKLGFTNAVELDDEAAATEVWQLPTPPPARDPSDGAALAPNARTIIEDACHELNTILLTFPEPERSSPRRPPVLPTSAITDLERLLGCTDYDLKPGRVTRSTNHEEDHPYYAGLGAVGDFADPLLLYAYQRQVAVDPANASYYFEGLQDLAMGRNSDLLQNQVALLASQGFSNRREVHAAYRHFGINPERGSQITDAEIIGMFKSRLSDIGPSMVEEARKHLQTIGYARNSDAIKRAAYDTIETYEQALSWFDLDESIADEFVHTMYTIKVNENPASRDVARTAVTIIAQHRKSQRLLHFLESGDMASSEMDTAEAYALLGIDDRTATLDLQVLASSVEMQLQANPESEAKYTEALALVQKDQKNQTSSQSTRPRHPPATWPVGISNIGNTCYLNSVLQFLFTVKPLRETVLNCDEYLQVPTPEAIEGKVVGRQTPSLARVEDGRHFVQELRKLFQEMIATPNDTIRPGKPLAILALKKEEINIDATEKSTEPAGTADGAFIGPLLPPYALQGSRPPTPADSAMGDYDDAKSDANSMKAMDLTGSIAETKPEPPSRPPPIPPRPQVASDNDFSKAENVARQQDAAESLNNIFDLFSCAFKSDGLLRENEQDDIVKRLFYADVTTVRISNGKETSNKSAIQDTIAVTPNDRTRKLSAALDDEFGLSETEPGVTKYEFVRQLPPIQIFNARRLLFTKGSSGAYRNESHLALDPVMYMDRYMDATKSLSRDQLQELRNNQWRLQAELRNLEARRTTLKETGFKANGNAINLPAVLEETALLAENLSRENPDSEPEAMDTAETTTGELSGLLRQRAEDLRPQIEELEERMSKLEEEIDNVFTHSQDHPYRLHAIFMHAGGATSGHYWIFIHDFQNKIWRKYNDEYVDEVTEEEVHRRVETANPAISTGIVYVREDVALTHTEAVCRRIPESNDQVSSNAHVDGDVDTEMKDTADYGNIPVINGVVEGEASETSK
ncbi:cysteine proteinase [Massarina eburnea CBS 473.64]|uniref:ubiquitinyl hydrolase 1 n=1 Tax=Massarina eburnea CBS 473.64 TaxID=1395130 RepID=A0A6A6S1E1_9PLEO|nr:cysteine proteinase [Massarina eburnea CBS 473.64]